MSHPDPTREYGGGFTHLEKKGLTDKLQGHYGRYARAKGYKK